MPSKTLRAEMLVSREVCNGFCEQESWTAFRRVLFLLLAQVLYNEAEIREAFLTVHQVKAIVL